MGVSGGDLKHSSHTKTIADRPFKLAAQYAGREYIDSIARIKAYRTACITVSAGRQGQP